MTYLDIDSFGPTRPLAEARIRLLGLTGQPTERTAEALLGLVSGDTVACRPLPGVLDFWRGCPPGATILVVDDPPYEDPLSMRASNWLHWSLLSLGVLQSAVLALMRSPPKTERHRWFKAYQAAVIMAAAMDSAAKEVQHSVTEFSEDHGRPTETQDQPYKWHVVDGCTDSEILSERLASAVTTGDIVGIDTEADVIGKKPNEMRDRLEGLSFSFGEACYYVPRDQITEEILDQLTRCKLVGSNLKWDLAIITRELGCKFTKANVAGDTMLAAYLMGEPEAGLKALVLRRYGHRMITYADVTEGGKKNISEVPTRVVGEYCCGDSYWGRRLALDLAAELEHADPRAFKLYQNVDLPLIPTLIKMETRGILLDRDTARADLDTVTRQLEALRMTIQNLALSTGFSLDENRRVCRACRNGKNKKLTCEECNGQGVFIDRVYLNPGSDNQVRSWLHGHLGLPVQGLTEKTQQPSVAALSLLRLRSLHPAAELLLVYHSLTKHSSFLEDWLSESQTDSRIHTVFANAFVVSGRLSSRDPNLQQVKIDWRKHFVPTDGLMLGAADYGQLEVRIAASQSQDTRLLAIVNADPNTPEGDMHAQTLYHIFGIPFERQHQAKHIRTAAKVYNFASLYGAREKTIVEQIEKRALEEPELNIPIPTLAEARKNLNGIWELYRGYFREYVPSVIAKSHDNGNIVRTAWGRPRFVPDLASRYKELREAAERETVNHTIQGTAGDMARMSTNLVARLDHGWLLLQVHDELVFEFDPAWRQWYLDCVIKCMELNQPLRNVPLVVDTAVGPNWASCHK